MQKWFFLEDPQFSFLRQGKPSGDESLGVDDSGRDRITTTRNWLFRVRVTEPLGPDETLCVTGNVPELGSWHSEKSVPLVREGEDSDVWSKVIGIPDLQEVQFRYCVCVIIDEGLQVIVRSWETNVKPRIIDSDAKSPTTKDEPDLYGDYNMNFNLDRGWLNKETVIQLKLLNNPLTLWRPKYTNRTVYIKVTPVNLLRHHSNIPKTMSEALDESLSTDTQDMIDYPPHAFTEVAALNSEDCKFTKQGQFGKEYKGDEMLIFQSTVLFPTNIAFLIDLYIYSSKAVEGDPPYHAGFSYLLPSALQSSEGNYIMYLFVAIRIYLL